MYHLLEKKRKGARARVNKEITPARLQYQPGEFVRVSFHNISRRKKDKTRLVWIGPYIIDSIVGDDLYRLKDPLGNDMEAHSARLKWYDGKNCKITEEVKTVFLQNYGRFEVKKLLDIDFRMGEYVLLVWWRGFTEEEATWVPIRQLMQDVPELTSQHLIDNHHRNKKYDYAYNRHVAAESVTR